MTRYRALSISVCFAMLITLCACQRSPAEEDDRWSRLVDLSFKDTPLTTAVETLLRDSGISYTISPALNHVTVNAVFRRVSLGRALAEIARAAGAELQVDGDVVNITTKYADVVLPGPHFVRDPDAQSRAISLSYLTPGEAAALVARPGTLEAVALPGGRIVLRGSERALSDAETLLKALDTENVLPRVINIKFSVTETGRAGSGGPIVTELDVGAVEGMPTVAELTSGAGPDLRPGRPPLQNAPRVQGSAGVTRLVVRVIPTVNTQGEVCLTGTVSFSWSIDSQRELPEDVTAQEISTARCARPGEPVTLGTFTRRSAESGAGAELEIKAVATVTKQRVRVPPRPPGEVFPGMRRPDTPGSPRPPAAPGAAPGGPLPPREPALSGPPPVDGAQRP